MKRVFLIAPLEDNQTGYYVYDAFRELGWAVAILDPREVAKKVGLEKLQTLIVQQIDHLNPKPDLLLVLKGLEVSTEVIEYAKRQGIKTACWIYDATLNGVPLHECKQYIEQMKHYDTFYTYCDNVDELFEAGLTNVKFLAEGYDPVRNGEQIINYYLEKKFGSDILFIGSMDNIHPCREDFLERVIDEGFELKIYGEIKKKISPKIHSKHQKVALINEFHSYASQASKICLGGLDSDFMTKRSHSARVYRTLACGGFYLCRRTAEIEKDFTIGVHLDVFDTPDEMVEKIVYYLNHPEERKRIADAGKEKVKEYTFEKRLLGEFGRGDVE